MPALDAEKDVFANLLGQIEKHPEEWVRYLVLADWCEENHKDDFGFCLRWMAKNKKRPQDRRVWRGSKGERMNRRIQKPWQWLFTTIGHPGYCELPVIMRSIANPKVAYRMTYMLFTSHLGAIGALASWLKAMKDVLEI